MMPFVPLCFIVDTAARARPTLKCSLGTFLFLRPYFPSPRRGHVHPAGAVRGVHPPVHPHCPLGHDGVISEQDAVFLGSDCIDSYFDAMSALRLRCERSLTADLFLTDCLKI